MFDYNSSVLGLNHSWLFFSAPGSVNELAYVMNGTSEFPMYRNFLSSSILVTGAFIFGTDDIDCIVDDMVIRANVSTQSPSTKPGICNSYQNSLFPGFPLWYV